MKTDFSKKTLDETSFDQLDWKNGSLTGNGLKQAVDMFKAQDAGKQTAVIYDHKSRKAFNILDVRIGNRNSGHGLEIDIDTSKEIQEESKNNMKNEDSKPYYTKNDEKPEKITDWQPTLSSGKTVEVNEINPYPKHMWAAVERIGAARSGKWQVYVGGQELLKSPLPRCIDANKILSQFSEKYWKHLDESDLNEADDRDPLSHALDLVGVKASTANSKAQDEVQMSATDGNTTTGVDAAIDRDIDAAMEEIYC